jgi:glycerol-3-phosphate dehydrogenase (NAD(P)+)
MTKTLAVVGGGPWGIALAAAAARNGAVRLLSRRNLGDALPAGVEQIREYSEVTPAQVVVLATPSEVAREVARALSPHLDGRHYVVHGVRGLEGTALHSISDIVRAETAVHRVGALGGPALASDLLAGRPNALVCGARFTEVNVCVSKWFSAPVLRVYTTQDLRGLEWASALVGCLAILVGSIENLELGPGLAAALICRSVAEAARIAAAAGGNRETLFGLAGYGDLLAAISQHDRPEVVFGRALAAGKSADDALAAAQLRVEAVDLIPRLCEWARAHDVRTPIFRALAARVSGASDSFGLLAELTALPVEDDA